MEGPRRATFAGRTEGEGEITPSICLAIAGQQAQPLSAPPHAQQEARSWTETYLTARVSTSRLFAIQRSTISRMSSFTSLRELISISCLANSSAIYLPREAAEIVSINLPTSFFHESRPVHAKVGHRAPRW